jgi:hypothetical protein
LTPAGRTYPHGVNKFLPILAACLWPAGAFAAPRAVEPATLQPVLDVGARAPVLRLAVAVHARELFHTPTALIAEKYLTPAAAPSSAIHDEGRNVVAGMLARPDDLELEMEPLMSVFGRQAVQRVHHVARALEERGELGRELAAVRKIVALDRRDYAAGLQSRLDTFFDASVKAEAGEVVKDGREAFEWRRNWIHPPKGPAALLPFAKPKKAAAR